MHEAVKNSRDLVVLFTRDEIVRRAWGVGDISDL
jgi:hypothetical protein